MVALGYTLYGLGIAINIIAVIWSFVVVFRENQFLAILCLFLPLGLPVALILRWPRTWRPLCLWVLGLTVFFCGLATLSPAK